MSAESIDLEKLKQMDPDAWYAALKKLETMYFKYSLNRDLSDGDRKEVAAQTVSKIMPKIQRIDSWAYVVTTAIRCAFKLVKKRQRELFVSLDDIEGGNSIDSSIDGDTAEYVRLCRQAFNDEEAKRDAKDRLTEKRAALGKKECDFFDQYAAFDAANPDEKTPRKAFALSIDSTENNVNVKIFRLRARSLKNQAP